MQNYEVRVGLWAVFHTIMGLDENLGGGGGNMQFRIRDHSRLTS